jgi:hypothetical protein
MRDLLLNKLKENMVLLENEKDPQKQDQIVSLMAKCVELLSKLESTQRT